MASLSSPGKNAIPHDVTGVNKETIMPALLTRDAFRAAVFARDANKCVICGQPCADAHHIILDI